MIYVAFCCYVAKKPTCFIYLFLVDLFPISPFLSFWRAINYSHIYSGNRSDLLSIWSAISFLTCYLQYINRYSSRLSYFPVTTLTIYCHVFFRIFFTDQLICRRLTFYIDTWSLDIPVWFTLNLLRSSIKKSIALFIPLIDAHALHNRVG